MASSIPSSVPMQQSMRRHYGGHFPVAALGALAGVAAGCGAAGLSIVSTASPADNRAAPASWSRFQCETASSQMIVDGSRVLVRRRRQSTVRIIRVQLEGDASAVRIAERIGGAWVSDQLVIINTPTTIGPSRYSHLLSRSRGERGGCVPIGGARIPVQASLTSRAVILEVRSSSDESAPWIASAFNGELMWTRSDLAEVRDWLPVTVVNGVNEKAPIDGWAIAKFVRRL